MQYICLASRQSILNNYVNVNVIRIALNVKTV